MIAARVNVNFRVTANLKRGFERAPGRMKTGYTRTAKRIGRLMVAEVRQRRQRRPGERVVWQTERQRRAYFASDGFGAGIPYQRAGRLPKAWKAEVVDLGKGAGLILVNRRPEAQFAQGAFMQRMHMRTHTPVARVVRKYQPRLTEALRETWRTVSDPYAGVPR
jgi:hypothetical protein